MLCQYRDLFGQPNQGVHSYRWFNLAIVDVLLTILVAYLLSVYFDYSFGWTLLGLLLLGVGLHRLFCVNTTINQLIFGRV